MKIVHVVQSLDPKTGGPSVSVPKLAKAQASLGHDVQVQTIGPGSLEDKPSHGLIIKTHKGGIFSSIGFSSTLAAELKAMTPAVIHCHGLWQRQLHYSHQACRSNGAKLVISPRGMLSPWAWHHNNWKKRLAMRLLHPGAMDAARGWHATSAEEAQDIRFHQFKQLICTSPNGVEIPTVSMRESSRAYWQSMCPAVAGKQVALFYSRFHRKKRVLELIESWMKCPPKDWILLMVGIPQEYTVAQIKDYVLRNAGQDCIHVFDGTDCPPPYSIASLFVLPSHSENFGMVVAESLSYGVPTLVTDTMPWRQLNQTDFGWCGPWEDFAGALKQTLSLGGDELRRRGEGAVDWVAKEFSWENTARKVCDFYVELGAK